MSLLYVCEQLTIYVGIFILIIGIFGNGMNLYIFSSTRTYRTTPTTFYFLIESIFKTIFITMNLMPRIVTYSVGIDLSRTSVIWCRLQEVFLVAANSIAITCTCLAAIDQFFVTSSNASLRRISKIERSYRIIFIVIIIWLLHSIPTYFNLGISPITHTCITINPIYGIYVLVYFLLLSCTIPVLLMVIFGLLTYRNIRQTTALVEQRADRQLIKMVSTQVVLLLIGTIPVGINNTYTLITLEVVKNQDRQMAEYSARLIASIVSSLYFAVSFYTFLISSSRFRKTVKERLFWWQNQNRIQTSQT